METTLIETGSKAYHEMGIFGIAVFLLVIAILYPVMLQYKKWIDTNINGRKIDLSKCISILKIKNMIDYTIPRLRIYCPLRKAIFQEFLTVRLEIGLKKMYEIADTDINKMDSETFQNFLETKASEIIIESEDKAIDLGIPKLAIEKFNEINRPNEEMIRSIINTVSRSTRIYDNNTEKAVVVFNMCEVAANAMLVAAEDTIDNLNGQLTGVTFRGKICNKDCPDCTHMKK